MFFCNLQHLIVFWRVILFEPLNSTKHLMTFHQKNALHLKVLLIEKHVKLFFSWYDYIIHNPSIFTETNLESLREGA